MTTKTPSVKKTAPAKKVTTKRAPRPVTVTRSDFIYTVSNINDRIDRLESMVMKTLWAIIAVFGFAIIGFSLL